MYLVTALDHPYKMDFVDPMRALSQIHWLFVTEHWGEPFLARASYQNEIAFFKGDTHHVSIEWADTDHTTRVPEYSAAVTDLKRAYTEPSDPLTFFAALDYLRTCFKDSTQAVPALRGVPGSLALFSATQWTTGAIWRV